MPMRRVMEVVTPLGDEVLLFYRMSGREESSRLSEFQLELLSARGDIDLDKILGKSVTVKLELPNDQVRCFNGYVTRFAQVGLHGRYHLYHATLRPWLWFLTRTADCRIFQDKTVPEIIKDVFGQHGIADFKDKLSGSYHKWEYCVQYRETDFNFTSRLMEQEGIYYYFTHTEGRHTLVLSDAYSAHEPAAGCESLPYIPMERVRPEQEQVSVWNHARGIQPGAYVLDDFDFEKPSVDLMTNTKATRHHDLADYEVYDYPGEYLQTGDGDQYVRARMDELSSQFELAYGQSNARGLRVGHLLKLTGHPRRDQNREYLVVSADYSLAYHGYEAEGSTGADYACSFTVMNSQQQFRPNRITPKPVVQGPQTAIVVGPAGDEIYTDKYGRVKVQFHWDRYGNSDENSSCWVRASHPWAGKNWGMVAIPRIGQEVIVDFLEGDPDRPIITGRVYNAEQMPPWALPANKTQTGVLTRSSKGGSGANANAIRFEDKKGEEQLWIHAEKNQDIEVENNETHWVGHDRKKTIDNDENVEVKNNRTEKVGVNEDITIGANRTEKVGANETIDIGANRTETVGANESITVAANRSKTIGASETVTIGATQTVTIGASKIETVGASVNQTIGAALQQTVGGPWSMTAGGPVTITAPAGLTIVSPGGNRTIDNVFDKIGGLLSQKFGSQNTITGMTYSAVGVAIAQTGSKVETTGTSHAATALNYEVKGLNMAYVGLKCEKASFEIKTADAHIIA